MGNYPRVDPDLLSKEEQELELQYTHRHIYAVGHGAAVDWSLKDGRVHDIRIKFIPGVEVPQVTADPGNTMGQVLRLSRLAGFDRNTEQISAELARFTAGYQTWINSQVKTTDVLSGREKEAASRIIGRMEKTLARMKKGVSLLETDEAAAQAFAIANEAMLLQMSRSDQTRGKKQPRDAYQWRPFQLAFFLAVLESAVNEDSLDRDRVDLIWFPTGGGKTEAYLGVTAFLIAWRRLTHPVSGSGTSVLMRYTLRLLTAQQYLRATRIICALELIRRKRDDLGKEPVTIGMWVGMATSPNAFKEAARMVSKSAMASDHPSQFQAGMKHPYGSLRRQPWINESAREHPGEEAELAQVLSINDTRVHSPQTFTALVIPPESRIQRGSVVDRLYVSSQRLRKIDQPMNPLQKKSLLKRLAEEFRCTPDQVESAIEKIRKGYPTYGQTFTKGLLLEAEYQALTQPIPDQMDDEDFVTCHQTREWKALAAKLDKGSRAGAIVNGVSRLISVKRLKEILIFKGFKRLNQALVPPDIVGESDWLPALELYGEGIFFTLEERILNQWEALESVRSRGMPLQERYKKLGMAFEPAVDVNPRFILLHTLAHLIIRQLESHAGYPAASLKERIFSSTGKAPMGGILIYVAVPDVEGSLGGLFELAEPDRFLRLLSHVFNQAMWCSLDPVCSEHEGQGPGFLNRAACHACTLVPEPSCAFGNMLLDRGLVKGTPLGTQGPVPDFLDMCR